MWKSVERKRSAVNDKKNSRNFFPPEMGKPGDISVDKKRKSGLGVENPNKKIIHGGKGESLSPTTPLEEQGQWIIQFVFFLPHA